METWAINNKPLTPKTRHHIHIDEKVGGINICITIWIVIVLCVNNIYLCLLLLFTILLLIFTINICMVYSHPFLICFVGFVQLLYIYWAWVVACELEDDIGVCLYFFYIYRFLVVYMIWFVTSGTRLTICLSWYLKFIFLWLFSVK